MLSWGKPCCMSLFFHRWKVFSTRKTAASSDLRRKAIDRDEWRRQSGLSCEACAQPARSYAAAAAASTIDLLLLLRNFSLSLKIDCKVKPISFVQYWAPLFVQTARDMILTWMTTGSSQRSNCKMAISWWDVLTQIPVFVIDDANAATPIIMEANHFRSREKKVKMSYGSSQKVQKVMVQPINLIFRCSSSGIQVFGRLIIFSL